MKKCMRSVTVNVLSVILISVFPLFALSPVATHGTLKVSQGKIVGAKDNKPVQLAGMSLFWSLWEGEKFYNKKVVNWLVQDWNITVIRAAMGVGVSGGGGYDSDNANTSNAHVNRVKTIVDAAIANGIYVIVDYHAHNANINISKAKEFFSQMAREYGSSPNVIWEIWNEPDLENGSGPGGMDTWGDIRNYASEVIPVIRQHSDNLIVVGTPSWSQAVDSAALNPILDSNVAYTLHFYAGTHKDSLREIAQSAIDLGAPLFITEFGLTIADGGSNGLIDTVETKIWLDWADSNGISWVNWSIVDKREASAALISGASTEGGWAEDVISESGKWVRNRLRARPVYEYDDIIPIDGKSLPGIIEAESFTAKSEELKPEQTSDAGAGENLAYTTNGAWAEYSVNVRIAGEYTARLRVAADAGFGGTISLKFKDNSVACWDISSTGGWQNWVTTDSCQKFYLPKGETKLRIEWSGTASSLVNLNWIEFKQVQNPISIKNRIYHSKKEISDFRIKNGNLTFYASKELTSMTVLSVSGRVLCNRMVKSGMNEVPLGRGLYFLRLKKRNGLCETFKLIGTRE